VKIENLWSIEDLHNNHSDAIKNLDRLLTKMNEADNFISRKRDTTDNIKDQNRHLENLIILSDNILM